MTQVYPGCRRTDCTKALTFIRMMALQEREMGLVPLQWRHHPHSVCFGISIYVGASIQICACVVSLGDNYLSECSLQPRLYEVPTSTPSMADATDGATAMVIGG